MSHWAPCGLELTEIKPPNCSRQLVLGLWSSNSQPIGALATDKHLKELRKALKSSISGEAHSRIATKALSRVPASSWLKALNSYYLTLRYPLQMGGARVPDMAVQPTIAFSTTDRFSITAGANGLAGIAVALTNRTMWNVGDGVPTFEPITNIFLTDPLNSTDTELWAGATDLSPLSWGYGTPNYAGRSLTAAPLVANTFSLARIVSAGVYLTYTGASLQDSGLMASFSEDTETLMSLKGGPAGSTNLSIERFDDILQMPNSTALPVNQHMAMSARFTPKDQRYLSFSTPAINHFETTYLTPGTTGDDPLSNVGGALGIPLGGGRTTAGDSIVDIYKPGVSVLDGSRGNIGVVCKGLTEGTTVYAVLRINWEGLPLTGSYLSGQAEVSTSDSLLLDHGLNESAKAPLTGTVNVALPPSVSKLDVSSTPPLLSTASVAAGAKNLGKIEDKVSAMADASSSSSGVFDKVVDFIKDDAVPFLSTYGPEIAEGVGSLLALL